MRLHAVVFCVLTFSASAALAQAPAAPNRLGATPPTMLVMPYVQPGAGPASAGLDTARLYWFTDQAPGNFAVEYVLPDSVWRKAVPTRRALDFAKFIPEPPKKKDIGKQPAAKKDAKEPDKKDVVKAEDRGPPQKPPREVEQHYFKYSAELDALPLDTTIRYRVKLDGMVLRDASFHTRASADKPVRCVMVGDLAQGRPHQRAIAYRMGLERPDFLVALGDIVYPTGRMLQYMHYFWDTYANVDQPGPLTGAPLLASVPLYPVLGNHDISAKLAKAPDAFAAYYFFTPPQTGPGEGPWATPLDGTEAANARFREATKDSYPYMDAYSFESGPAHFVVINVNPKIDFTAPALRKWLTDDLRAAKDRWKFVCYHMPAFHSSKQHYAEQQVRPLNPLFEELGVTMTFAGHVHNYQRTVPIKFVPDDKQPKAGRFNGTFTLDKSFDGVKNTQPDGVIHIVAGGGGAGLYGPGVDKTAAGLRKDFGANYADFTAKDVVDTHSFVTLDIAPASMELRAVGINGEVLDRVRITKTK